MQNAALNSMPPPTGGPSAATTTASSSSSSSVVPSSDEQMEALASRATITSNYDTSSLKTLVNIPFIEQVKDLPARELQTALDRQVRKVLNTQAVLQHCQDLKNEIEELSNHEGFTSIADWYGLDELMEGYEDDGEDDMFDNMRTKDIVDMAQRLPNQEYLAHGVSTEDQDDAANDGHVSDDEERAEIADDNRPSQRDRVSQILSAPNAPNFTKIYALLGALFDPARSNPAAIMATLSPPDKECLRILLHNLALTLSSQQFQEDYTHIVSQIQAGDVPRVPQTVPAPVNRTTATPPKSTSPRNSNASSSAEKPVRGQHSRTGSNTGFYTYAAQVSTASNLSCSSPSLSESEASLSAIDSNTTMQLFGDVVSKNTRPFRLTENENSTSAAEPLSPGYTQFNVNSSSLPPPGHGHEDEDMGMSL